ncbi:uncharacterized protein HKW66_Vig0181570 [Vigna angularis]|uniref:Uncharacterized protein n=1 Tax=Phaseolus angularis TaxID=3914 RepID=A0A8T0K8B7_PHAAN|nr:uncharacterized protein HKW66_Vig0181570 [Vigna angularis]
MGSAKHRKASVCNGGCCPQPWHGQRWVVNHKRYLVDSASSHMLVSKIKPCMCNNSRANTCNKPRLLEGMHLLDKRSMQALPVALMIHDNSSDRTTFVPAMHHSNLCPINFRWQQARKLPNPNTGRQQIPLPGSLGLVIGMIKKLVVRPWVGSIDPLLVCTGLLVPSAGDALLALTGRVVPPDSDLIVLAFGIGVMINRDSRGHSYFIVRERKLGAQRRSDTVQVSTINDVDQGSADVAFRTPLTPYEKSKSLGSGGSMVARLKLKGIDGRAPPGVEPAT